MGRAKSKVRKSYLDALRRRLAFITAKARHDCGEAAERWYRQEIAALEYTIAIVEAAVLIGTIDELETVASIQPDPEAWAARGEIIAEPI